MEDPGFELKVVGLKMAGLAAGVVAAMIGFNIANALLGNGLVAGLAGLMLGAAAYKYAELVIEQLHLPIDKPPPRLYRLDERQAIVAILEVFDKNPFIDPIDSMPHDWRVKTDADAGEITAKIDFQEKWGHEISYKEVHLKETVEERHISVVVTVKQETAGTSITQDWTVISPKRRDFANKVVRQMSTLFHDRLTLKEQGSTGNRA